MFESVPIHEMHVASVLDGLHECNNTDITKNAGIIDRRKQASIPTARVLRISMRGGDPSSRQRPLGALSNERRTTKFQLIDKLFQPN